MKNYQVVDYSHETIELLKLESGQDLVYPEFGVIKADWSKDIEAHFNQTHEFVYVFDLEEMDGNPQQNANHEAIMEVLDEEGFDVENIDYLVIIRKELKDYLYNKVNNLFHEKLELI